MEQGRVTSHELVMQYLTRIAMYENILRATITVNPHAIEEADRLDRERAQGRVRGPLHGIPVAVKDNILTNDMPTTGGTLAFEGYIPPYDATLIKNLRDAGAIILAKTNLSELAGWIASRAHARAWKLHRRAWIRLQPLRSAKRPAPRIRRWASRSSNRRIEFRGRNAASFWAANVGTETGGSILSPSNQNMLVGIKPTVGRISRWGVIPITADQDTAGPMGRTMTDAAIMLGVLESPAPDPNDPATTACTPPPNRDYTPFLKADGLKGARIGIPRAYLLRSLGSAGRRPGASPRRPRPQSRPGESDGRGDRCFESAGRDHRGPGQPAQRRRKGPDQECDVVQRLPGSQPKGKDADCSVVFKYGMKRDFNKWLASLGPTAPVKTLTELRIWNHEPHQRRRHPLRPGHSRRIGRNGSRSRSRAL